MYQEESHLTDADRRAIADIRRELDAEFGPLADDSVPDAFHRDDRDPSRRDDPDAYRRDDAHASRRHVRVPYQHADTPRSRRRSRARHRSTARRSRRGLVVAFVLGMLAGTGLGCVSMFLWQ